jgi:(p)ppGpp synthase/HD superfamily hydrolase
VPRHKRAVSRSLPDDVLESTVVAEAMRLAYAAHDGDLRHGRRLYVEHPIEVAQMLHEQGFGEAVLAAAILHDVVEETELTVDEIEQGFGSGIARLVELMTDEREIADYKARKEEHRTRIKSAGVPAAAIYAADKLSNLRELRTLYREEGETAGSHFKAPFDAKVEMAREDIDMLRRVDSRLPLLPELEGELMRLRMDLMVAREEADKNGLQT